MLASSGILDARFVFLFGTRLLDLSTFVLIFSLVIEPDVFCFEH